MVSEALPMHDIIIARVCQSAGWERYEHEREWHTAPRWVEDPQAPPDSMARLCALGTLERLADIEVTDLPSILLNAGYLTSKGDHAVDVRAVAANGHVSWLAVIKGTLAWKFLEKRLELGI